jgi:glycosyltransferase involved in cell wall biosynthesis
MHILFVTHYYEPSGGAAATRLSDLARRLCAHGHRVTVLTGMPHYPQGRIDEAYRGRMAHIEMRDGVQVIYTWLWATASPRISRKLVSQLSLMLSVLLRGIPLPRPDVTFIEAQPIFTGVAGRIISRLKGVPYVLNVSDLWPDHLLSVGALQADDTVYKMARSVVDSGYRGAAAITALSPAWTEKITDYLNSPPDAEKVYTILRGVDVEHFRPLPNEQVQPFRETYNLADKKVISVIGTFATQYDFASMLDVAERLQQRDDVRFMLIGTGSQQAYVQERSQELSNVRLIDWLPHDAMPLAWNASTVTMWAMRDEDLYRGTIPARFYEALSCGIPVVAAQGGACRQLLEESEAGLVVAPGDSAALADNVTRLLVDAPLHQQMRKNARQFALENFSFKATAEQYLAILERVQSG